MFSFPFQLYMYRSRVSHLNPELVSYSKELVSMLRGFCLYFLRTTIAWELLHSSKKNTMGAGDLNSSPHASILPPLCHLPSSWQLAPPPPPRLLFGLILFKAGYYYAITMLIIILLLLLLFCYYFYSITINYLLPTFPRLASSSWFVCPASEVIVLLTSHALLLIAHGRPSLRNYVGLLKFLCSVSGLLYFRMNSIWTQSLTGWLR